MDSTRIVLAGLLCILFLVLILDIICVLAERPNGLKPSAIAALPTFVYPEEVADECSVCLSIMEKGEVVRRLPGCNHVFHVDCIDMWLHSHSTCPLCRADAEKTLQTPPEVDTLDI